MAGLIALVERQQAELLARTEAASMWQARAELLGIQLTEARETIRALEAPTPRPRRSPLSSVSRLALVVAFVIIAGALTVGVLVAAGWAR